MQCVKDDAGGVKTKFILQSPDVMKMECRSNLPQFPSLYLSYVSGRYSDASQLRFWKTYINMARNCVLKWGIAILFHST